MQFTVQLSLKKICELENRSNKYECARACSSRSSSTSINFNILFLRTTAFKTRTATTTTRTSNNREQQWQRQQQQPPPHNHHNHQQQNTKETHDVLAAPLLPQLRFAKKLEPLLRSTWTGVLKKINQEVTEVTVVKWQWTYFTSFFHHIYIPVNRTAVLRPHSSPGGTRQM